MSNSLIPIRLKALRHEKGADQDKIAEILRVNNRQTVSAIESGERKLKASEIIMLLDYYNLEDDYFTDPYRLVGEGDFCWRQSSCSRQALESYQAKAGRCLAAFRALTEPDERPGPRERLSLRLWEHSSYEDAWAEGERVADQYNMGEVPAERLASVMEEDFGVLVLMVDMDENISGAACRLPELDAVFVNRNEAPGRRNFDLAHEFFHLLTWQTMPPKPVESTAESGGGRVEQLANNFAGGLLMPWRILKNFGEWRGLGDAERATRMRKVADILQVTVSALHFRLLNLGVLPKNTIQIDVSSSVIKHVKPQLFSKTFLSVFSKSIDRGDLSRSKALNILSITADDFVNSLSCYGIDVPLTMRG